MPKLHRRCGAAVSSRKPVSPHRSGYGWLPRMYATGAAVCAYYDAKSASAGAGVDLVCGDSSCLERSRSVIT